MRFFALPFLGRLLHTLAVLFLVSVGTVLLLDLMPGDPAAVMLGESATPDRVAALREQLGLEDSFFERYTHWVNGLLHGDMGSSIVTGRPVFDDIIGRLQVTLELAVLATLLAIVVSVPAAVYCAFRTDRLFDRAWTTATSLFVSVPGFVAGVVLAYVLAVQLHALPLLGWVPLGDSLSGNLRTAALPVLALSLAEIAVFSRVLRADLISTLQEDFVVTAKAKGLHPAYILFRHALRPSTLPLMTLSGLSLARIIGGTVVIESIFSLPGLGQLVITSVTTSDVPVVQGS
ncbi:ABC transporter permease [Nocardioides humi]|uniref:ABC transporter permease n=1 Tax=Nocardioides humi TaxID=449461 RepID=UPI001C63DA47|nr:ABC transporter permease [Nocardioides humi]